MGVQTVPGYIAQNVDLSPFEHPVELMRNLNKGLFDRSGVLRYGDFNITTPGSGLVLNVAAGEAFLLGAENNTQGGYFLWSNAAETVNFSAPSGSIRYDTVLLRVRDPQYGTISGNARASIEVVAGSAGAGAARADSYFNSGGGGYQPGAWLRLADVQIDPAVTSIAANKITQFPRYVRGIGGVTVCTSTTRPSDPILGDRIFETNTQAEYFWDGAAWRFSTIDTRTVERGTSFAILSNTTLTLDSAVARGSGNLRFTNLPANATYRMEMLLVYGAAAGDDLKIGWTVPASANLRWHAGGLAATNADSPVGDLYMGYNTEAGTDTLNGAGAGVTKLVARPFGYLKTGSGGTFEFMWSQGTSGGVSGTTVFAETNITLTRVS